MCSCTDFFAHLYSDTSLLHLKPLVYGDEIQVLFRWSSTCEIECTICKSLRAFWSCDKPFSVIAVEAT
jgi:hypothetical protein